MTNPIKLFAGKLSVILFFISTILLQSCSEPADKFFDVAVLNTNTMTDFGTPILAKHINDETIEYPNTPSSKKKGNEALTQVQNNILYMEKALKDIEALSANSDSRKALKEQAISLYKFVIPVYKNEYTAYAKLCDAKGSQEQKEELAKLIEQKYYTGFEKRYTTLIASGKAFAQANNIDVHWN